MDSRIRDVLRVLDAEWPRPPSVAQLAAGVGLRPSRLEHLFRRDVQTSIRGYVQHRRMEKAATLLTQSHERISAIAFSIGFNDVSNFNHVFKKHFGRPPREYRRAAEADGNSASPSRPL